MDALECFAAGASALTPPRSEDFECGLYDRPVFHDTTFVAGGSREVECRWSPRGYWLRIGDVGTFVLPPDGGFIGCSPVQGCSETPCTPKSFTTTSRCIRTGEPSAELIRVSVAKDGVWPSPATMFQNHSKMVSWKLPTRCKGPDPFPQRQ